MRSILVSPCDFKGRARESCTKNGMKTAKNPYIVFLTRLQNDLRFVVNLFGQLAEIKY